MSGTPASWFHDAVIEGVQRLVVLNLADRPAAEVLPLTAVTWVEVVWSWMMWSEQLDASRLRVGFANLAASAERWPAPHALRAHLPARKQLATLPPAAPCEPTAEQRAKLDAAVARIRKRSVHSGKGPEHPLTRGNFPAAHEDATESALGSSGGLELS